MSDALAGSGGSSLATANAREHETDARAKRSLMIGFDGVNYQIIRVTSNGAQVIGISTSAVATIATEYVTSATIAAILSSNVSRKKAWIQNVGATYVRVMLGSGATSTSAIRLVPQVGTYPIEMGPDGSIFLGPVTFYSESGVANVVAVEETA